MAKRGTATPRLRFPEFRSIGAWEEINFDLALKFQPGFPFPSKGFNGEGIGLRLIRNRDLRSDDIPIYYSDSFDSDFVVSDGDILVGMDGDFTPCVWSKGKALLNQRVGRVLAKDDSDQRFLLYLLTVHLKAIEATAARTTVKHLSHSDVEKISEPVPTKLEQQKIADCLTSLDEVIAAQGRKVEALKAHKRGLMQQLFPRAGETRPRLRFPEFRNVPEWETDELETLLEIPATYGIVTAGDFQSVGVPMLRGGDIKDGRIGDGLPLVTEEVHAQYMRTNLQENDVVIALVGYPGEAAVIPSHYIGANISRAVGLLRVKAPLSAGYLVCFLNSPVGRRTVLKPSAGSAQIVVNLKQLNELMIPVPSPDEQQSIASCLSSLDTQITAESGKLVALKAHKQGLMQQLFPAQEGS